MKPFVKAVIATASVFLAFCIFLCAYTAVYFNTTAFYYMDAPVRREAAGTLETLVSGASYALRGIDPAVLDAELDTCSYNLGGALMTMQGRYTLLKKEVERNPVQTVIFEISSYHLSRNRDLEGNEGDLYVLGRLDSFPERMAYAFSALRIDEYGKTIFDAMDRSKQVVSVYPDLKIPPNRMSRGFAPLDASDRTMTQEELETLYHSEMMDQTQYRENVRYFEKCIRLCKERGIRMILVATPISDRAVLKFDGMDEILAVYRDYAEQYDLEFYDFNLLKEKQTLFPADTAYFDDLHLSRDGAATFTPILCRVIREGADPEDFFNTYEEAAQAVLAYYNPQ